MLGKDCNICKRLGKNQCGYHKFKTQCLSKMNSARSHSPDLQPTTTVFNGRSSQITNHPAHINHNTLPQQQIQRKVVELQYQRPTTHSSLQERYQNNTNLQQNHQIHQQQPQYQEYQHQQQPQTHIMRIQNGQEVYYPIYPVYQVVYEPVQTSPGTSMILSNSHIVQ